MKKETKKKVVKEEAPVIVDNQCPACNGIGLARPDWVNSDKCKVCNGNGVI